MKAMGEWMRKVFGGFLGLAALLFLGLAYTQMANAEEPTCGSELSAKIVELVNQDKTGIIKLQLRLATLKLAAITSESQSKTIESHIAKQEKLFDALMADGNEIQTQLITLYQRYGEKGDEQVIADRFGTTLAKFEKGDYRKLSTRLKNLDLSAFTLAHSMAFKEKSPFTNADTAVLWFQSEVSEGVAKATRRGSAPANSQEVSSQILRLTGNVAGVEGQTLDEMNARIKKTEIDISEELDRITNLYRDDLSKSCSELANCKDCKVSDVNKTDALETALVAIRNKAQEDPDWLKTRVDRVIEAYRHAGMDVETAPGHVTKIPPSVVPSKAALLKKSKKSEITPAGLTPKLAGKEVSIPTPILQNKVMYLPEVAAPSGVGGLTIQSLPGQASYAELSTSISQENYDSLVYISAKDLKRLRKSHQNAVDTGSISLGALQVGDCTVQISLTIGSDDNYSNILVLQNEKTNKRKTLRLNPPTDGPVTQSAMSIAQIHSSNPDMQKICLPSSK